MSEGHTETSPADVVTSGRVVVTRGEVQPYKVVLKRAQSSDTEHAVASIREGEDLIRSELPTAPLLAFAFGGARESPLSQAPGLFSGPEAPLDIDRKA